MAILSNEQCPQEKSPEYLHQSVPVLKRLSENFLVKTFYSKKKSKISEKEKVQTEKSKKKSEESCFSLKNCLNFRL